MAIANFTIKYCTVLFGNKKPLWLFNDGNILGSANVSSMNYFIDNVESIMLTDISIKYPVNDFKFIKRKCYELQSAGQWIYSK